jgi:hypothetical protein
MADPNLEPTTAILEPVNSVVPTPSLVEAPVVPAHITPEVVVTPEPEATPPQTPPEALPASPLPNPKSAAAPTPTRPMSELLAGIQPTAEPFAAADKLNPIPDYLKNLSGADKLIPVQVPSAVPEPSFQTATPASPVEAPVTLAPVTTEAVANPTTPSSRIMSRLKGLVGK